MEKDYFELLERFYSLIIDGNKEQATKLLIDNDTGVTMLWGNAIKADIDRANTILHSIKHRLAEKQNQQKQDSDGNR